MGDLKEPLTVHSKIPLLVLSLYITLNIGMAAASEPFPSERGRFSEWSRFEIQPSPFQNN